VRVAVGKRRTSFKVYCTYDERVIVSLKIETDNIGGGAVGVALRFSRDKARDFLKEAMLSDYDAWRSAWGRAYLAVQRHLPRRFEWW
jgi:hypothetical protein